MKVVVKTLKRAVIEVYKKDIKEKGFDVIWDSIRTNYSEDEYDINLVEDDKEDSSILFFELTSRE